MKKWMTMLFLLLSASLTACNTLSGAGQDVQAVGEAVEDVAENVKEKLKDDDDG